jgi:hypothetical protein
MKNKLITGGLILIFLGLLPISCIDQCNGPCGCYPVFEVADFSITAMSTETLFRADQNFEVEANRYYFHQSLYKAFWVSGLKPIAAIKPEWNSFSFVSQTYACSPPESYSIEKLKVIRLINKKTVVVNANETLQEGEVINEKFSMTQNFHQEYSLTRFMENRHRFLKNERLYLKFTSIPSSNIEIIFDLEIELDNGVVYRFDNETMKINGG